MPKISKTRGTGYEYRIAKWFKNEKQSSKKPLGWDAERNSLSREEKSFGKTTAKHDVKAWKDVSDTERIFLQIEAKKTGKDIHTIEKKWIDKIDFGINELLVIALNRTGHFAVVDICTMPELYDIDDHVQYAEETPRSVLFLEELEGKACKIVKCRGEKSVRIHKKDVEQASLEAPMILNWDNIGRKFCIFPLYDFVKLREKLPPNVSIMSGEEEQDCASLLDKAADIPVIEVDKASTELIVTCPRTSLPLKIKLV